MEKQLYEALLGRLDAQNEIIARMERKLDGALEATASNTTSIWYIRAALGAAWAAVLGLIGVQLPHR